MSTAIIVPATIAQRLREKAERLGMSVDEYLVELLLQDLDPRDKARDYIEAAIDLLKLAEGELEKGNIRQAAEKVWSAAALAVKAYALWREGRRLSSHGELWEYKDRLAGELGDWVTGVFREASNLHTCFYEDWCTRRDVEEVLDAVRRLVDEVVNAVRGAGEPRAEETRAWLHG